MRRRGLGNLPCTNNIFIGITFYRLWCRKYSKELHPQDPDCNMSESRSSAMNESEASFMNHERSSHDVSVCDSGSVMDVNVKLEESILPSATYLMPHIKKTERFWKMELPPLFKFLVSTTLEYDTQPVLLISWLLRIFFWFCEGDMDPWLLLLKPPEEPDIDIGR